MPCTRLEGLPWGHVLMMNGGPVSWSSTLLGKTIATSTCEEAEVNAAVAAVLKDSIHIKQVLVDMGLVSQAQDQVTCKSRRIMQPALLKPSRV
jgi:hypothetical protein